MGQGRGTGAWGSGMGHGEWGMGHAFLAPGISSSFHLISRAVMGHLGRGRVSAASDKGDIRGRPEAATAEGDPRL